MYIYLTIKIGLWDFFKTFRGLLPLKKVFIGFLDDDPIITIWSVPAVLVIMSTGSPISNELLKLILFLRKNFAAHFEAFLKAKYEQGNRAVISVGLGHCCNRVKDWVAPVLLFSTFGKSLLHDWFSDHHLALDDGVWKVVKPTSFVCFIHIKPI